MPAAPSYLSAAVRCLAAAGRADEARTLLGAWPASEDASGHDTLPSCARVVAAAPDAELGLPVLAHELLTHAAPAASMQLRGELHLLLGDVATAETCFERSIAMSPDSLRGYFLLLNAMWKTGRLADARKRFEAEAAARPEDAVPPTLLGAIASAAGDPVAAEREYRRALQRSPRSVVAANNLACLLADRPEAREEALGLARRVLAAAPFEGTVLDTHGWLTHLSGKSAIALPEIQRAARLRPESAAIRAHLAETLAALDRVEAAREAWAAALRLDPDSRKSYPPSLVLTTILREHK
jgi:tetratricopeptide (TPR) repeat protein